MPSMQRLVQMGALRMLATPVITNVCGGFCCQRTLHAAGVTAEVAQPQIATIFIAINAGG